MCQKCHEERDDDYDGNSIESQREKAVRSIIKRHPELGLAPADVSFRFAPRAEEPCVRVNVTDQSPQYELHIPSYTAQAMAGSPPLSLVAMAGWIETDKSYENLCEILEIRSEPLYSAFFVSEEPPLNPVRADDSIEVNQFEEDIQLKTTEEDEF
jgi:hypothetical protein